MKIVALFSGGKDSCYALYLTREKYDIKYLATIHSQNPESYMYHTPNIGLTLMQSKCLGIQLVSKESKGEKEKELEDLKILLKGLEVKGVVCGAVESEYQKQRVERICKELGLKLIAPLWKMDQEKLLRDMIKNNFEIIITAVSADGFDVNWLGRKIDEECLKDLIELRKKKGISIIGEGGEFETLVIDCPLYSRRIEIVDSEKKWDINSGILEIKDVKLLEK
jgi:ABC transporter with metal-binding/Fe-S-binding domain ATP-binding protein